jgi:hypothetical protein
MKKPKKLPPKKVRTTLKEDIAKILFEVGRMAIGGIVIVVLLRGELSDEILLRGGLAVAVVCFILNLIFGKREIKAPTKLADKTLFHRKKTRKR